MSVVCLHTHMKLSAVRALEPTNTFGAAVTSLRPLAFCFPRVFVTSAPRFANCCHIHTADSACTIALPKPTIWHSALTLSVRLRPRGGAGDTFLCRNSSCNAHIHMSTNVTPNQSRQQRCVISHYMPTYIKCIHQAHTNLDTAFRSNRGTCLFCPP